MYGYAFIHIKSFVDASPPTRSRTCPTPEHLALCDLIIGQANRPEAVPSLPEAE